MKRLRSSGRTAAFVILASCAGFGARAAPVDADNFIDFHFSPTNGKVGYHMAASSHFTRRPAACGPTALANTSGYTVSGAVPPGLSAPDISTGNYGFEGTPREPGDWTVRVTVHDLTCQGAAKNYGDMTAVVNFHIEP